jgi:hypothetical protein
MKTVRRFCYQKLDLANLWVRLCWQKHVNSKHVNPEKHVEAARARGERFGERSEYGIMAGREEGTPMLKCEGRKQCARQCERPSLQEAAELKSKNGLWVSKGAQRAKKKAA